MWNKGKGKANKNGKLLADLIVQHNLVIQNDGGDTYSSNPNVSRIIIVVLRRSITRITCCRKN